ncbi:SH3 domain-containing protein [Mesorhizobium sp. CN2-181]|uniref:SH3 domain-containing protein n=1 Tax=Mesorhizobium yinganensis TaxID=3157707 RepID=UPI0032B7D108
MEAAPRVATADATAARTQKAESPQPSEPVTAVSHPDGAKPTVATVSAVPTVQVASATEEVSIPEPMQIEPLDPTDPRWISALAGHAATNPAAAVNAEASKDVSQPAAGANAYSDDDGTEDKSATAAIPAVKPIQDATQPEQAAEENAAEEEKVANAGRAGRTSRAVTMRARPSSRGGVLGTVPGSTNVQVVSCDQWCEIIYKGKRGFVYKSFLRNNGR